MLRALSPFPPAFHSPSDVALGSSRLEATEEKCVTSIWMKDPLKGQEEENLCLLASRLLP